MIPTRVQIQAKIKQITSDPQFSTLRQEVIDKLISWLDSLKLPVAIVQFGDPINPKEKIIEDLDTYEF